MTIVVSHQKQVYMQVGKVPKTFVSCPDLANLPRKFGIFDREFME